ncbi:MAG: hypothetical protein IKQ17_07255 [Kiritimatiellae bacterium]|nr:hypothetical protein [Kiritimatiellia bacterium]
MKDARQAIGKLAVAATALSALSATADIKYWDNPEYKTFDVDCYVKIGDNDLIWNYDGIRNVGETADHDPNALIWANLGSFGSANDIVLQRNNSGWTALTSAELSSETYGKWTDNGFTFKGNSRFRRDSPGKITVGTSYTIQFLVDATASGQKNTLGFLFGVQFDQFSMAVAKNEDRFYWRNLMAYKAASNRHSLDSFLAGGTFDYGTAIVDGTDKTTAFFSGTKAPTSGEGFRKYETVYDRDEEGYVIGSTGSATGYEFVGTIKFFRVYNHALSDEEVAWNRVVDERRFFNRTAPLPVTNVVVATSVAGAYGVEPDGCYAVDGRHTFVAPATVNVGGIDYVCTGYTVETLGEDGWSTPVFHKSAIYQPCAFVVSDTDCVRLTWQWAKSDGLKNLGYTVNDYVWDGLEVFYDGICNVGTNLTHSYSATNWVNLGSKGKINDMFVQRLNVVGSAWETAADLNLVGGRDPGYWTEQGFVLKGDSRFRCNAPGEFNVGTSYSLQMLVDAKISDQGSDDLFYLLGANNDMFAFRIKLDDGNLYWRYKNNNSNMPYLSGGTYDYVTAIMHAENKQTFFSGMTEPASGNGYKTNTSYGYSDTGFCLGGYGKIDRTYLLVGTLKNFRQYNHALTAEEVVQNRKVDDWRYFGIPDNPDVIVQSTVPYLRGDEPDGPYAVDGTHVFTAPATVTAKGITYACDGYIVETLDGSTWSGAASHTGNTYEYNTSAGMVRLTWKWKATHGLRTAADYSFDDYSQAGLLWNYDGIRNQGGTDADHNPTATTWKNLGSGGATYDLSFKSGTTTTGEWAEDGYIFRDGPRFWSGAAVGPIKSFTLQTLVDADIAAQPNHTHSYIMSVKTDSFNISLVSPTYSGSASNSICWTAQQGIMMYFHTKDLHYTYATAMMDFDAKQAMMFPDTTIPTEYHKEGVYGAQRLFHQYTSVSPVSDTGYGLGNANNANVNGMVGKIKNFRYYDRVLTEEEIVRNRNVDAVRYFGALGVTNVYVVAGGGTQAETGAYKVEGEWTFHATTVDKDGVLKPVKGFYTQTLENGQLSRRVWHDGDTFKYSEDDPITGGKTVHLTWAFGQPGMCIILR